MRELLFEIGEFKGQYNSRRAGRWIARKEGRIVNGKRFERDANKSGGRERWRVVMMTDKVASPASGTDDDEYDDDYYDEYEGSDLV